MIGRISYNPTILRTILPFYDPNAILKVLIRWDRKIMRSYDLDRDFDNHGGNNIKD